MTRLFANPIGTARLAWALTWALSCSLAAAQPAERLPPAPAPVKKKARPKPKPPTAAPADPYAAPAADAPVDPYAPPRAPAKKATPADPYADAPAAPPAEGAAPIDPFQPVRPGKAKPAKQKPVDPYAAPAPSDERPAIPARVSLTDTTALQGLLAVQRLDGWLLADRGGENVIARRLVAPDGNPARPWFYLVRARGEPIQLVHASETASFAHLPGQKLTYQGHRDMDKQLKAMLRGVRAVAVEYSAKGAVPSVSRVDAGTLERIRAAGVQVRSSDLLVQYTKAIWGDAGRTAHYVAAHHLVELRKDALAFIAKQLSAGAPVTEYDVQQRLVRGMTMRGLVGAPPSVAAGVNTADPYYVPTAAKTAPIKKGDLIVLSLAAKLDKPDGVYAAQTWCAVADATVRAAYKQAFETASLARDHALSLIADRARRRRPLTGADVDRATRAFIAKAGFADRVLHRTGHSIDTDLQGGGADLDDLEVRDTRILTAGTGVTVGPGLYLPGEFGVRTEVSVYLAPGGLEITTPAQDEIELLLR